MRRRREWHVDQRPEPQGLLRRFKHQIRNRAPGLRLAARRRGAKLETLWILWRYDWQAREWKEIARAQALDSSWALILKDPALRALRPAIEAEVLDPAIRGREVTDEILGRIDAALSVELPAVRIAVLTSIYDQMAGRIVAA